MLGCGCGVSIHPQLYDQSLEKYQVLPRTYLGGFKGGNGEKWQNKNGCYTWQEKLKNGLRLYLKNTANKYWQTLEKCLTEDT